MTKAYKVGQGCVYSSHNPDNTFFSVGLPDDSILRTNQILCKFHKFIHSQNNVSVFFIFTDDEKLKQC